MHKLYLPFKILHPLWSCSAALCLSGTLSGTIITATAPVFAQQTTPTKQVIKPAAKRANTQTGNPASNQASNQATIRLARLAARYYAGQSEFEPIAATFNGNTRFNDRLPMTLNPAVRQRQRRFLLAIQKQLASVAREQLNDADQMSHDCIAYAVQSELELKAFNDHLLPMNQIGSMPVTLAEFAGGQSSQPFGTPADYAIFLRRMSQLPAWSVQAIANMREGIAQQVVLPRALVVSMLPQLAALVTEGAEKHPYYAPINHFPASFSETDKTRLRLAYATTIREKILPAMRTLDNFVQQEYLPASRESAGLGALPNGENWYRARVKNITSGILTPEEIHTIGLNEVARIQNEFAQLGPKLGYDGPPAALPGWIAAQEKYYPFKNEAEILDAYRALNEKIKPQLPRLFGIVPKAALDIRLEPEISRATASHHYTAPARDGSRPGVFWAVISDPKLHATTGMTTLFLHEGQPGHHFQIALAQELNLPDFRRMIGNFAFIEGWALYAETLGHEMGLYENDPNASVGHLTAELLRAARLVVDTGLHAKGWTREQTITYLQTTLGYDLATARIATERYMAWPGQALAYKIGALKIGELRQRAKAALGEKFDLRAFHDAILSDGTLPLPLLEAKMARWINSRQ